MSKYPEHLNLPLVLGGVYYNAVGRKVKVTYITEGGIAEVCDYEHGYFVSRNFVHNGADFDGQTATYRLVEGALDE